MNNLESKFKQALESHEVDYNPQAWESFKQKLDGQSTVPNGGSKTLIKLGVAATVVTTLSVGAYFLFNGSDAVTQKSKTPNSQVDVIENPSNQNQLVESDDLKVNNHSKNANSAIKEDGDVQKADGVHMIEAAPYHVDDANGNKDHALKDEDFNLKVNQNNGHGNKNENIVNHKPEMHAKPAIVLNANFTVSKISGCEGLVCQFTPKQSKSYQVDYVWDFGDGTFSKERSPRHTYRKAGNFVVKLTLRSEIDNEDFSDEAQEYVVVYPKPKANFEIEEMSSNSAIPEFDFTNTTDRASSWVWVFGDQHSSMKKDPSHTYRKKGLYKVKLIAENSYGCKSEVSKTVRVDNDYNLLAPTGFTPNGDGLNDWFIPKALEIMDVEFTMSVFNKNGQLYYETNQVSRPWDGRYMMDNQNAPSGAYVWVVKLKNRNGETEVYKGSVTLLRN